jgi:CHAT domain-containing protein
MYGDGAECYTGVKAAKDRFLEIMKSGSLDYEHIVFATHGFFGKELAAVREPALALSLVPPGTDGFLRMSEVGGLKMNAGLVVLTACRTGLGRRISGEGTMGMGRAFQYSGAKCVLTSLWSVEQSASVGLVDSLFKHLREGKSRLDALKSARRDIRDQGWDHPFFWAAFVLVGEAR